MNERATLAEKLTVLNTSYTKLVPRVVQPAIDINEKKRRLTQGAQLLADFYPQVFVKEYRDSKDDSIMRAGRDLEYIAKQANEAVREDSVFLLGTLLTSRGSKVTDHNEIDRIIEYLR